MAMNIIEEAKALEIQGRVCESLDVVFDAFDDWFLAGEFDRADALLPQIDVRSCPTDILLTVLTASSHAKPNLKNRAAFFEAVKAEMVSRGETDPTLLSGLD